MSRHLTRAACAVLFVLLLPACGERDPFETSSIEQDLEDRTIRDLYEEAEKMSYTPPPDGLLKEEQIATFVRVSKLAMRILEVAGGKLDAQVESASRDDDRFSRMATAFSAIGNVRNAATAYLRASLTLGVNPHEFEWIAQQINAASRTAKLRQEYDGAIARAKQALDAESDYYLRSQKGAEYQRQLQMLKSWESGLGDVTRGNGELVGKHADELAPYIRALRER